MGVNDINSKVIISNGIKTTMHDEIRFKSAEANALSSSFATALSKHFDMTRNKVVDKINNDNAKPYTEIKFSSSEMANLVATMRKEQFD